MGMVANAEVAAIVKIATIIAGTKHSACGSDRDSRATATTAYR